MSKFIPSLDFRLYDVLMWGFLDFVGGGKNQTTKPINQPKKPKPPTFSNVPLKVPSALTNLFPEVSRSTLVHCSTGSSSDKLHPTNK